MMKCSNLCSLKRFINSKTLKNKIDYLTKLIEWLVKQQSSQRELVYPKGYNGSSEANVFEDEIKPINIT